jgi:hypothetical protein
MKKTLISAACSLITLTILFSSCSINTDVVSNKKIQKRKYQNGFFLAKKSNTTQKDSNHTEYAFAESNDLENTKEKDSSPHLNGISNIEKTSVRTEKRIRKENHKKIIQQIRELNDLAHTTHNNDQSPKEKLSDIGAAKNLNPNYEASIITAAAVKKNDASNLLNLGIKLLILGLILFVLGLLLSIGIGALGNIFFLLSSLAWIGGLVCIILHYIDVYDL